MAEDETVAGDDRPSSAAASAQKEGCATARKKQQQRGVLSRLWRGIFGGGGNDYEKRLKYLSKEEASVHARMKRRALRSRRAARNVVVLAVILEVVAVIYAVMTTRSLDLDWKMRALRVLPMFALPIVSTLIYFAVTNLSRIFDLKDQKTLENLRAERQAKIDELKERTNYYMTQQLIQRYDLDPAAKAAAATVLASKLGADSGLKVFLGDESAAVGNMQIGKSNDVELVQLKGLRNRKQSHTRSNSTGTLHQFVDEASIDYTIDGHEASSETQRFVEHYKGPSPNEGGWLAKIAALLVGEDPSQCYALICGNCHMHNGLARKEDFSYVTYYCPHCHALNGSQQGDVHGFNLSCSKETETASTSADGSISSNPASLSGTPVARNSSPLKMLPEEAEQVSES
ncbi:Uncharacterized protein AXF42_Ash013296 [Apostasia shenzhenica]|uniref:Lunapark zinc ribbon domain-containing protein n=1 Tax=Apostasia shenzhenica TaxID=1088818 RepID=A0A2I0BBJ4_9ASPA|nr:Uncharacterized protein AXF42_Ash013296 [Apostasia shenzhenica]